MLKVAICDDENLIAHQIENNVYNTCSKEGIKVDTEVYYNGNALEKAILTGQNFDLIYLDIQMENGDGITTAKNIRKMDENVLIIFISSYDRYLMELFQLDVFSFIKKPIDPDAFSKKLLEANQKICSKTTFFVFKYKNREYKVLCKDILYFESKGKVIDALINVKYAIAKGKGIEFVLKIFIPEDLPINQCDMGIILGNALDNAIEATEKCRHSKKEIDIIMGIKKGSLVLVVKNPYENALKTDKAGNLVTTKKEFHLHGYGISSIRRVAEKYHGDIWVEDEEGQFVLTATMNLGEL